MHWARKKLKRSIRNPDRHNIYNEITNTLLIFLIQDNFETVSSTMVQSQIFVNGLNSIFLIAELLMELKLI